MTDEYFELVHAFPLRPLRDDREHAVAVKILSGLLGRPEGTLTDGERDYAQALARFVQDYDDRHCSFKPEQRTPLELLRYLMKQSGTSVGELGEIIGNRTAASMIFNGRREMSKPHIRAIAAHFKIDAGGLLGR